MEPTGRANARPMTGSAKSGMLCARGEPSRIALRSIRATRACLCRAAVNPCAQKYSTLPKFGFGVCVVHPDPAQGAVVRRHEPRIGERWTRGSVVHERREQGGLNPVRSRLRADERRSTRTAKSRGPGCRCYSQALRRRGEPDRAARAANSRGDVGKQELVSGESAPYAVKHRAGKAG